MMAQSKQADFFPAVLFYDVTVRQDRFSLRDYILMHVLLAIGLGMLYDCLLYTSFIPNGKHFFRRFRLIVTEKM